MWLALGIVAAWCVIALLVGMVLGGMLRRTDQQLVIEQEQRNAQGTARRFRDQ